MSAERTIGNYVLGPLLGRGGMSEVHAAEHRFLGDRVAIKLLRTQLAGDPAAAAAFIAEATRTRAIDHPGVVRVLDAGSDGDAFYLVMERLDGESLAARLARAGRLDEPEARRLGAAIADGLAAAHARGIVHRDLKPGNLMLVAGEPRIIDFGIAREVAAGATGSRLGTVAYMAPEQITDGLVAPCVDVWALGVVLYEAVTGRLPFDGFDGGRTPQLFEPPPAAPLAAASPALAALIIACLERDPARRPPSMAAIAAALRDPAPDRFTEELPPTAGRGPADSAERASPGAFGAPSGAAAKRTGPAGPAPADGASRVDPAIPARADAAHGLDASSSADARRATAERRAPAAAPIAVDASSPADLRTARPAARTRRSRLRALAAVAALAVVVAGSAWLLRARGPHGADASAQPTANAAHPIPSAASPPPIAAPPPPPPGAAPPSGPVDSADLRSSSSRGTLAPSAAQAAASPAPNATGSTPTAAPPTAAAGVPVDPAHPAASPRGPAPAAGAVAATLSTVEVRSAPAGASIIIGGVRVGTTPAAIAVALPASILVTHTGYRPSRVRAERAGPIDVRLTPSRRTQPAARPRRAGETLD